MFECYQQVTPLALDWFSTASSSNHMADSELDKALISLIETLRRPDLNLLPPASAGLPEPGVSLVSAAEKSVGIGARIANQTRGPLPVVALKGHRLEAVVRFQLWAGTPEAVEQLGEELQRRMQEKREQLRQLGFLRLVIENTALPELVGAPGIWRQIVAYRVLYEFQFRDNDGAESLIARIPIDLVGEFTESTVVTDEMVRWDEIGAPALEVHRRGLRMARVNSLVIFAFLPDGFDGEAVTISVSIGGAVRQKEFPGLRQFRDAFALEPETPDHPLANLGGHPYRVGAMAFPNADFPDPIAFTSSQDVMEVSYAAPSLPGGNPGVIYLRAI